MSYDFKFITLDTKVPKSIGGGKRKPWNLPFPVSKDWKQATNKLLLIIDHVPTENLANKALMSGETGEMVINVLSQANRIAKTWGCKENLSKWGICVVPWGFFKTYDLDRNEQSVAEEACIARMKSIIEKMDPTHVHFFGDRPFQLMYGKDSEYRGRVFSAGGLKVSSNISITNEAKYGNEEGEDDDDDSLDDMDSDNFRDDNLGVDRSNLLGHACENLARLINGSYPFSLRKLKATYVVVDTIKAFDKLIKRMWKADVISYDTETFNLSATQNGIALAQFTLPDEPTVSYEIPLKHMSAPWDEEQLKYIYFELRKFFAREFELESWDTPILIGQNIGFDLRVIRVELGIPVIFYRVHDCMAGEHCLDENLKGVPTKSVADLEAQSKNRPFALDVICARYELVFYYTADFSKGDRHLISDIPLTHEVFEYGAMDTVAPYHIYLMQLKRAALLDNDGEPFLPIFKRIITGVYSDTIHVQSSMMQTGSTVDVDYIIEQYAKETSDVEKEKLSLTEKLYALPSVEEANRKLLKQKTLPQEGLFAGTDLEEKVWAFDISKNEHRQLLFFKVLKLEPLAYTASGAPQVGKLFKAHYSAKDTNHFYEEVSLFKSIEESKKTWGYLKSYFEKMHEPDGIFDGRMRAQYGFSMVVTGRSNSFSPSLQQVPTHGQYAKIIKRCFVAKLRTIIIKMDYSAHEIGCWCIISGDTVLAETFKIIFNSWCQFRKKPTLQKIVAAARNDAHKINYSLFTGTKVSDIDKPMRQQSKSITFGAMYGKHVKSMAEELGIPLKDMEEIYAKFFGKFKKARKWLDDTVKRARSKLYTYDMFGCRRYLPGYLSANRGVSGAMDRRAQNSPIQGYASRLGFTASRLFQVKMHHAFKSENMYSDPYWDNKTKRIVTDGPDCNLNAMVHDSTEVECSYELVPLVTRAMEHCATNALVDYCTKMYGMKWVIKPQVDFDICDTADKPMGWNFTIEYDPHTDPLYPTEGPEKIEYDKLELSSSLLTCVKAAAKSHNKRHGKGTITSRDVQNAVEPIKKVKRMMNQFPLDLTPW